MLTIDFNRLNIQSKDRILDIGCGEGRHIIEACRFNHTVCVGADFGFDTLVETQKKIAYHNALDDLCCQRVDLSCMDITHLAFCDESFDAVICSEVLEHIPDDAKAISELARILRTGKTLAVSIPRYLPEKICWLLSDEYSSMGHVRIYRKKALIQQIESFGFSYVSSHCAHSIHTPYWWLKCLVGPNRKNSGLVNAYHKMLVWDLMTEPWITAFIDQGLNPVLGKSLVLYFKKH